MSHTMGSGKPTEDKVLSSAAAALGLKSGDELTKLDRKALSEYTQKQLFECAKRLDLKGVSKLSKNELAARVASEFSERRAPAAAAAPVKKTKKTPSPDDLPAPVTKAAASAGDGADSAWSHKFEVREHIKAAEPGSIPWSYSYDRVTGMAVDPDRLFVYWEVTDDAIERARTTLGKAGKDAWLNLRIYDTTDRIFDGTNAHSYFDHRVERGDRHWFFQIGKPSSSAFIDIGLRSTEGYFSKIVRSGRVEFSRREPATWGEPEWLSVRSLMGPIEHAGRGQHVRRQVPAPAPITPSAGVPGVGPRRHVALLPWEESFTLGEGGHKEVVEWEEHLIDGTTEFHRESNWESPVMVSAWEAGPFSFPVSAPEPVREDFVGPSRVYRVGGRTHVVHGPWQVVIKGVGAHQGRAVVAKWEIYRSWVAEEKVQLSGAEMKEYAIPGSSEKLMVGASELRWRYASELRLGGASEIFFLGASEYMARGASERLMMGSSQYTMKGSSERLYAGGSEERMRGASEQRLGSGSETRLGGASEARLSGLQTSAPPPDTDSGHYPSPDSVGKEPEHKD